MSERPDSPESAESDRALIILDMTIDRFRGSAAIPGAGDVVRFIQGELRYFRERGRLIVFASSDDAGVVIQELTPRSDEISIRKSGPSAFFRTSLDDTLRSRRVRRVTLVGLETHTSVLLTAADALARGFEVVVPDPCVCARDPQAHTDALTMLRTHWDGVFDNDDAAAGRAL
jgi:nicotinamidase-related amidase